MKEIVRKKRCRLWYMHDGVPPHFSRVARKFFDHNYPNRWVRREGLQLRQFRYFDINTFNLFSQKPLFKT